MQCFLLRLFSVQSWRHEAIRKDKGGEKLDETEENLLEHRTDGTDAFDTLYIGTEKFPHRELYPVTASEVM